MKCLQITEVRCPLFTGSRVQSSRMKRLWECGHLAVRDAQGPQDRHFHGVGALIQRGGRAVAGMLTIATAGGS